MKQSVVYSISVVGNHVPTIFIHCLEMLDPNSSVTAFSITDAVNADFGSGVKYTVDMNGIGSSCPRKSNALGA